MRRRRRFRGGPAAKRSCAQFSELLNNNNYAFDPKPNEGRNGQPVIIIHSFLSAKMRNLFHINRFNLMTSDRIPLDRKTARRLQKSMFKKYFYETDPSHLVSMITHVFHDEALLVDFTANI
ncbi:hypothetical protein V9T40_000901 [Parthenolecanium corni]|uniref:Uncharacterized protein n=1 Tax=Parthenolecanium corni TaxID=536013 RepID=A0AAN9Y0V9_9HEMI